MPSWPEDSRDGVGGWLLILARLLIVGHPIIFALGASSAMGSIAVRGRPLVAVLVLRFLVTAFGAAAGFALTNPRSGAVTLAKASLLLSAATDVFVYTTPYYPNNRMPGDTPLYVAASLAYYALWLAYLSRSKRVRATYGSV